MFAYFRFRFRHWRRRLRADVRILASWSRNYADRHIWGKWRQLGIIRRFLAIWWVLAIIMVVAMWQQTQNLTKPFSHIPPAKDASFAEGAVGQVKIINPVLPGSAAENDVSRLVFNGLVRYNPDGQLEPDLATSWSISSDGRDYTFHLRKGVKWQDGVPFTSQDVAFTLAAIQNPDSRSPLAGSWQGIEANPLDDFTVVYHLPNAYPPFLAQATQGLVPRHLLEGVEPSALRAANFNQKPIGTGPFKVTSYDPSNHQVMLDAYTQYFAGSPLIPHVQYYWYQTMDAMNEAYSKRQILAFGDVKLNELKVVQRLPNVRLYSYDRPTETILILRNNQPILKDQKVRAAINRAIDRQAIIAKVLSNYATPATGPLLSDQLGFAGKYQLPTYNLQAAKSLLNQAGWRADKDGKRSQAGQPLKLKLVTRSGSVDEAVAKAIKAQLAKIGIDVQITATDLVSLEQSYLRPRNYDMLLFGYDIGSDPDVYAFWQSSQGSDPGLNLAVYSSPIADKALESARVNSDPAVRKGKYLTFQQQWLSDVPSVPLYSADYIYAVSKRVVGPGGKKLIDPTDRFYNIQKWTIAAEPVQ